MEDLNDRPTKKQKQFQYSLPAEIIENILNHCPNFITLESFACTCKQINKLVSRIFAKNIVVKYYLKEHELFDRTKKAKYLIKGNGDAILEYDDDYMYGKTKYTKRKLSDRNIFDKQYKSLLDILSTTDPEKFKQFLTEYQEKSLFDLAADKISFDVQVDQHKLGYRFNMGTNDEEEVSGEFPTTRFDPEDLYVATTDEELSWDELDANMISRLKGTLCATQIKSFFNEIYYDYQVADHISIEYECDSNDYNDWELKCDDSGYVEVSLRELHEGYHARDLRHGAAIQFKPSHVTDMFIALRDYHRTLQASRSEQQNNNSELPRHKREDRCTRQVTLKLDGSEHKYEQLTSDELTQLMDILQPVVAPVTKKMLAPVSDLMFH